MPGTGEAVSVNLAARDVAMADADLAKELEVWQLAREQGLTGIMELTEGRILVGLASRTWQRVRERARQGGAGLPALADAF